MSEKKQNVPKLRFPGFTEPWEQRKVVDISDVFIGLVTTMTANYRNSGTLLIRNSDIRDNHFEFDEKPVFLDRNFAEKNSTRKLQVGDVVTVHTGDIGASAVITSAENGAIGFATINTRPNPLVLDSKYLSVFFNSPGHKKYAIRHATGDGRSNYNLKDFNKLLIPLPNLNEQKMIGNIFFSLNSLITLHQRKLEHVKKLKAGLLQKMFPKNGETVPEVRFPGFTDPWEQRKLSSICEISGRIGFRGYTEADIISKDDGGILTFSPSNIIEGCLSTNKKNTYITPEKYEESPEIKVEKGDILFVKTGSTLGKSALVSVLNEPASINPQIVILRTNNKLQKLLSVFLMSDKIQSQVAAVKIGGAVPTLTESEIKKFGTILPSNENEAEVLGKFYSKIDNLITLHQRKLDHLKLLKKGLLQQMFV